MLETNVHIARGELLYQQGRSVDAEREFRAALLAEPENAVAHAMIALCLLQREKLDDATAAANEAIRCAPAAELSHRVMAHVLFARNRFDEAFAAATQAAELSPFEPEIFSLLASIQMARRDWNGALDSANQGLSIDPEHVECQNWRAMALVQLGRRDEAGVSIGTALSSDPDNAFTHANQGWTLLHRGKPHPAMEHFREALRLDPEMEWARQGIVEALKSRNWIYRVLLLYFLWMSRLSRRAQWGIMIGGFVAYNVLRNLANKHPDWRGWIWPVLGLYIAFAVMTWLADPLFNPLLRLNRFGSLVLSRQQIITSNWIGGLLLTGIAFVVLGMLNITPGYFGTLVSVLLIIPVSSALRAQAGWPRKAMIAFTAALGLVGVFLTALVVLEDLGHPLLGSHFDGLIRIFVLAAALSPWLSNALLMSTPKR